MENLQELIDSGTRERGTKVIDLSGEDITRLSWVKFPDSLEVIDLTGNLIESLEGVQFPPNLKILNLSYNEIEYLGEKTILPDSLEELYLSFNKLEDIDSKFKYPTNLKIFTLNGNNNLDSLGKIKTATNLTKIDFTNTGYIVHWELAEFLYGKTSGDSDSYNPFYIDKILRMEDKFKKTTFNKCLQLLADIANNYIYTINQMFEDRHLNLEEAIGSLTPLDGRLYRKMVSASMPFVGIFPIYKYAPFIGPLKRGPDLEKRLRLAASAEALVSYFANASYLYHPDTITYDSVVSGIKENDDINQIYQNISK